LPLDIGDMIPKGSMVRVVDSIIDSIDHRRLYELYPGGGASAYNPVMLLKVVVFAYASGIYSSRRISQATRDNVGFLWLTGLAPIDHNTLNRFRSERIPPVFEDIFSEVIALLAERGYITLDTYFLDGTKIEAAANKFTFVWRKSNDYYMENLRRKVHAHLQAIDEMEEAEDELAPEEPGEVDADAIREAAERINERLKGKPKDKELKRAKRAIEDDYLPRMERYERQQVLFDGRNSYSKTDTDATFMRMKDDAMGNGQLKAGYNVQVGTENQIIVASTVHRRPGDTACAIPHLEHVKESIGHLPQRIVADAGYGSEENYVYLESQGADAYVKHQESFRESKNKKWREDEMRVANWIHDEQGDTYTCPEGRTLGFKWESHPRSDLGYKSVTRVYECTDCTDCSRRKRCIKSQNPEYRRRIKINPTMDFFKQRASEMLNTEEGSRLRKKRSVDVETVFGDIKRNHGFTRFHLRGLDKVSLEWQLVAMGHNMRKIALAMQAQRV
ncbi:MAG: IS1182 family transposase, partial [Actinobacteria bacterium]|nr:IS1182 family transposase [Actinomycetota bacterium]